MRLIIIGPQASGKGTQADRLAKRLNIPHLSTGDLFRQEIKEKTMLGQQVESQIREGGLVSDDLVWDLVRKHLDAHPEGWILDGFPRTLPQAGMLDGYVGVDRVILLEVPDEVCVERITGRRICPVCGRDYHIKYKPPKNDTVCDDDGAKLEQREDDTPASTRKRLDGYHEQTEPLIEHYQTRVVRVNGDQGIEDVWNEIQTKMELKSSASSTSS